MNKKEYEELQKTLTEVNATLADETLTADLRLQLENSAAALSGQLLSVWFGKPLVFYTINSFS
jgi:hypothetical protein